MPIDKDKVERLRRDLPTIRGVAGWSADHLAEMLDVSRQTIMNLESGKTAKMSVVQYLAIRSLLDAEIKESKNDTLKRIIHIFVDDDTIPESKLQEIRELTKRATQKVGHRAGSKARSREVIKVLAETKLSDIPEETILKGRLWVTEFLYTKAKQ